MYPNLLNLYVSYDFKELANDCVLLDLEIRDSLRVFSSPPNVNSMNFNTPLFSVYNLEYQFLYLVRCYSALRNHPNYPKVVPSFQNNEFIITPVPDGLYFPDDAYHCTRPLAAEQFNLTAHNVDSLFALHVMEVMNNRSPTYSESNSQILGGFFPFSTGNNLVWEEFNLTIVGKVSVSKVLAETARHLHQDSM